MGGSQLKTLKGSLHQAGRLGPQKSKKQKRKAAEEAREKGSDKRLRPSESLNKIRERFNPLQYQLSRGPKFPVTSIRSTKDGLPGIMGRPAVSLSKSEEKRTKTLLIESQRKNKVGGILDRRFGESDPDMTEEQRAVERFALEKQRGLRKKNKSLFDLEDNEDDGGFTSFFDKDSGAPLQDDFDEDDLPGSSDDDDDDGLSTQRKQLKRMRKEVYGDEEGATDKEQGAQERKKSKKEVMEEVIAKSKYHKFERQVAREEDDEERVALDKMLPELEQLLFAPKETQKKAAEPNGRQAIEKTYDMRLRQMIQDKKAEPTSRTKTNEEVADEHAALMKKLEEDRVRRMNGENEFDEDSDNEEKPPQEDDRGFSFPQQEPQDEFGLGPGIKVRHTAVDEGFDDEDDFLIEDNLVASGSDVDVDDNDVSSVEAESDSEDDEFIKGIILTENEKKSALFASNNKGKQIDNKRDNDSIPYTFPCPQSHDEFLSIVRGIPVEKLPVVVQRIRIQYQPKLEKGNKGLLGGFAGVLVQHIAYLADRAAEVDDNAAYTTINTLSRHIHSLAKTVPIDVGNAFRAQLSEMISPANDSLVLTNGHLAILTVLTLFSTSNHFHQVVTPAMLVMGQYLELKAPSVLSDYATGSFVCTLFLQYQTISKRYIPELVNFAVNTLLSMAPVAYPETDRLLARFPIWTPATSIRTSAARDVVVRKLRPADCREKERTQDEANSLKVALLSMAASLLSDATKLWIGKASLYETLEPIRSAVHHLQSKACRTQLPASLNKALAQLGTTVQTAQAAAKLERRPLELHHHRPLAIRSYLPRFEDDYNPDKHYDPNKERSDAAKLQAEYKREKKGALKELRKDARFMQREKLKIKKAKDAAYDKKYKRLVAEIQGQEGAEANAYERERQARKRRG